MKYGSKPMQVGIFALVALIIGIMVFTTVPNFLSKQTSATEAVNTAMPTITFATIEFMTTAPALTNDATSIFKEVRTLKPNQTLQMQYRCPDFPEHRLKWTGEVAVRVFDNGTKFYLAIMVDGIRQEVKNGGEIKVNMCARENVVLGFVEFNEVMDAAQLSPKIYIYQRARNLEP